MNQPRKALHIEIPLEALAKQPTPGVALDPQALDRVAELARLIAQHDARRFGDLSTDMRAYRELPEEVRAGMRRGVQRTVQALALLDYLERT